MADSGQWPAARGARSGCGAIAALGALMLLTPLFTAAGPVGFWTDVLAGAVLFILGVFAAWRAASGRTGLSAWTAGLSILVGVWVFVTAFRATVGMGFFWVNLVLGMALVVTGTYTVWAATPRTNQPQPQRGAGGS